MTFTNTAVDLETLPRFDDAELRRPDARYPVVVLGIVLAAELAALAAALVLVTLEPEARAGLSTPPGVLALLGALLLAAGIAWFAHKAASVIRYAVREHDVILCSGVFWRRETIQPIRRIQHVEQLQGPVARRFGLSKVRLFSAGTAHFAFEIPGLDAEKAAQLRQAILTLRESKLAGRQAQAPGNADAADPGFGDGQAARTGRV